MSRDSASYETDVGFEKFAIAAIRRATRHRHASLEAVLQLDPPLGQRRYLYALRGFELFLSAWEPKVHMALPLALGPWFTSRSRRDLLLRDLAQLDAGRGALESARQVCEQAVARIELAVPAGTFGSLYVLEGSALGGQVIARAARDSLGLGRDNGAAYFNGFDRHTGTRWTEFQRLLEEQVGTEPLARQQACDAACQTFDALHATFSHLCLDRCPDHCRDHAAA